MVTSLAPRQTEQTHTGPVPATGTRPPVHPPTWTERIVRAAAEGDQCAWNALVDRFAGLIWSVARAHRLSAADAADVAQTTWLRLFERLPELSDPQRVGAWLATTARRECLRVIGHGARCQPAEEVPEPEGGHWRALDADLITADRDAALWRTFARLPQRDQALLRLLTADPAPSYEEIGAALAMPIGSIGPTRARCLARLEREMAKVGLVREAVR